MSFWKLAEYERRLGYAGVWHDYITSLLKKYCPYKSNILFAGTADGSEIPADTHFRYFALDQLKSSTHKINRRKVRAVSAGR